MKFYKCKTCGKIVAMIKNSACPTMCCEKEMGEMIPGTSDGAAEKHVPVYSVNGNAVSVSVGSVAHPMAEAHYIEWIAIETEKGVQGKKLNPGEAPAADFALTEDDAFVGAYAYCNLHGLWMA